MYRKPKDRIKVTPVFHTEFTKIKKGVYTTGIKRSNRVTFKNIKKSTYFFIYEKVATHVNGYIRLTDYK